MKIDSGLLPLAREAVAVSAERVVETFNNEHATEEECRLEAARLLLCSAMAQDAGEETDLETTIATALSSAGASEEKGPIQAHRMATERRYQRILLRTLGRHSDEVTGIVPPQNKELEDGWGVMNWVFLHHTVKLKDQG